MPRRVWRIGDFQSPCTIAPFHIYPWDNRFDDSERQYRTIYCADSLKTCLREILADFRLSTTALAEMESEISGSSETGSADVLGAVKEEWLSKKTAVQAEIDLSDGALTDLEDFATRRTLEKRLASFLKEHSISHLDISELRARQRIVTQKLSRTLFDDGSAGIKFHSHLDNEPCYALFEFRASLRAVSAPIRLAALPELAEVCAELGIRTA